MSTALSLTLLDPERHIRVAIAGYPKDAIVDGLLTMGAHLSGYLVGALGGERLWRASWARRSEPRQGDGSPLLVDGAADQRTLATVAGALQDGVGDEACGASHA